MCERRACILHTGYAKNGVTYSRPAFGIVNDITCSELFVERAQNRGCLAVDRSWIRRSARIADELYHSGEKDEADDDHRAL